MNLPWQLTARVLVALGFAAAVGTGGSGGYLVYWFLGSLITL